MTKEQKEAIERLSRFKTIKVLYGKTFAMHIEQLKVLQEDIETVLNMLKNMKIQEENYKNLIADVSRIAKELGLEEDGTIDEIYAKIKEKDKEIELYKKRNKDLSNQILMLYKEQDNNAARIDKKNAEIEKYKYLYQKALDNTIEADRENIQLKKQIDLMAERIEWLCKSNGILLDKEHDENFTQEDIKQHFERKVNE